jgi:hypothetical protein
MRSYQLEGPNWMIRLQENGKICILILLCICIYMCMCIYLRIYLYEYVYMCIYICIYTVTAGLLTQPSSVSGRAMRSYQLEGLNLMI